MTRRVRLSSDFIADLDQQVDWLVRSEAPTWIERLETDVARLRELLEAYRAAGAPVQTESGTVMRQIVLSSTPYLAWYVYDESKRDSDIWLVRLFHFHQRRPSPKSAHWLPPPREES